MEKITDEYVQEHISYFNEKLGSDITVILINSMGERQKLLVPANS